MKVYTRSDMTNKPMSFFQDVDFWLPSKPNTYASTSHWSELKAIRWPYTTDCTILKIQIQELAQAISQVNSISVFQRERYAMTLSALNSDKRNKEVLVKANCSNTTASSTSNTTGSGTPSNATAPIVSTGTKTDPVLNSAVTPTNAPKTNQGSTTSTGNTPKTNPAQTTPTTTGAGNSNLQGVTNETVIAPKGKIVIDKKTKIIAGSILGVLLVGAIIYKLKK